jgi:PKD repeat protein
VATIDVLQSPDVLFEASDTTVCPGSTVQFTDLTQNPVNAIYQWDFGFTVSGLQNPTLNYADPGFYDASLLVVHRGL